MYWELMNGATFRWGRISLLRTKKNKWKHDDITYKPDRDGRGEGKKKKRGLSPHYTQFKGI